MRKRYYKKLRGRVKKKKIINNKSIIFYLSAKKEAKTESDNTKKAVKNIQAKVEKATLGDLGALAEIKAKLQEGEGDK